MTASGSAPTSGDHFRSGAGRLSLDFVRTLRHRGTAAEEDELADAAALAAWAGRFGPWPDDDADATPGQLVRARELREAAYLLITTVMHEQPPQCPASVRARLNAAAAAPPPHPALAPGGTVVWHAPDRTDAILSLIARDALDLASSPVTDRIRRCDSPDCEALFLDLSRPGTRRWCSMDTCGNRAKKKALRSRTAPAEAAPQP